MANLNNDKIDMDMDSVRVKRAENQYKFYGLYPNSSSYPTIGSFAGQSAPERFLGLRQVLFPFPSIDREGTPPGQLISRKVEAHHFFLP